MSDDTPALPEREQATNVIQAIMAVQRDLPGIGRGERSTQGYNYRGIEAITAHAQHLFGEHGVVFVPKVLSRDVKDLTVGGKPWTEDHLVVEYVVYGPGGVEDRITVGPIHALGRDNSDKGVNKCMTQAFKYALLQVLCIGDAKDDTDRDEARQADAPPRRSDEDQDQDGPPRVSFEEWCHANGWSAGPGGQKLAAESVKTAIAALRDAGTIDADRAKELWADYGHPLGLEDPPGPRSQEDHLAWWAEHISTGEIAPETPAEPETTEPPPEPDPGPETTAQPEDDGLDGLPEESLRNVVAAMGLDDLTDALGRRGIPVGENLADMRSALVYEVTISRPFDSQTDPAPAEPELLTPEQQQIIDHEREQQEAKRAARRGSTTRG